MIQNKPNKIYVEKGFSFRNTTHEVKLLIPRCFISITCVL